MQPKFPRQRINLSRRLAWKRWQRMLKLALLAGLGLLFASLLLNLAVRLPLNASHPVDAILVLGGSIHREIYAAKLATQDSEMPILIARGSDDPCLLFIFQRQGARLEKVWLEKCSNSTFGNFVFALPILRQWGVHKVKLITSSTHLPRAQWLAQIHFSAQGIAVELDIVQERGIPGNQESSLKTTLDVTRSLFWAILAQVIQPPCDDLTQLDNVDLKSWQERGFNCEHQLESISSEVKDTAQSTS